MTDSEWLHYRDLKSRCPACKRPAHIAKRDETFYFVDDEYNPFVRHAPVKTTEAVFRFSQTVTAANMGRSRRSRGTGSCRNAISFPAWEQCPQKQI